MKISFVLFSDPADNIKFLKKALGLGECGHDLTTVFCLLLLSKIFWIFSYLVSKVVILRFRENFQNYWGGSDIQHKNLWFL